MLCLVDDACHDEEEYPKVDHRDDGLLVAAEERAVGTEARHELVGVQEPKRAQNAQKTQTFAGDRCEEGKDRDHVSPSRRMGKLAQRVSARTESGAKISKDQETENQIEPFKPGLPRHERGADNEQDGADVEDQQTITEAMGSFAIAEIQKAQSLAQRRRDSVGFTFRHD